jgi:hypothetical protein
MDRQKFTGLLDMLNGGGAGRAGDTFEGGPLSGLLNALGIRPRGYRDRMDQMAQARPMPRPAGLGMAPRIAAPPPTDYIGQHFERNMAPPPAMDYIGQHFERNMAPPPPPADYIGQHFERNMAPPPAPPVTPLAAPPTAAARPFGDDPGRVREFAEWFTTTYGPDAFGMLPQDVMLRKYREWLDSRTGYRM